MRTECFDCFVVGLIALHSVYLSQAATKVWQRDNDIRNEKHWVGDGPQKRCRGLVLPNAAVGQIVLDGGMEVESIDFPVSADIILEENLDVVLTENTKDRMNCAEMNMEDYLPNLWMDVDNWLTVGKENNVAIPHTERVPCQYDKVVFPKGLRSGACVLPDWPLVMHSLQMGTEFWTDDDIQRFSNGLEVPVFFSIGRLDNSIILKKKECTDPTGCPCSLGQANLEVCRYFREEPLSCVDPLEAIGFCQKVCGGRILLRPSASIEHIESMLKDYTSDTYVSKVENGSQYALQVIFAEKSFDGTSLDEAKDLHGRLSKDYLAELYLSGPYYREGQELSGAMSAIFGSLCGVVLVFGLIFLIGSKQVPTGSIRNRLRFNARPLSSYATNFFAKYDNSDRVGLFSEGQSLAGSAMHLDRTSDNPRHRNGALDSPRTSTDTVNLSKEEEEDVEE